MEPRYPRLSGDLSDSQLPQYSDTRSGQHQALKTEHTYELIDSKVAWAVLKVRSRAHSSSHLPTFLEGDAISGSVLLELGNKEVHVIAVKILVTGKLTVSARAHGGSLTFLQLERTLWSKSMGDPHQPSSTSAWRYSGKLSGSYEWPFTLTLPTETTTTSPDSSYRLPQTFQERHIPTSIQYDLYVLIERSKFRMDSNLHTMLAYIPATQPRQASVLRQQSYRDNTSILGPDVDPNGWHTPGPFVVQGRIFDSKQVVITGSLYVARPASYTRGTYLPLTLTLSCIDDQALDLLSSPNVIRACLSRRIKGCKASTTVPVPVLSFNDRTRSTRNKSTYIPDSVSIPDYVEDLETAVWWPSATNASSSASGSTNLVRVLQGEINLPKTLKPSSCLDRFAIEYTVVLCHWVAPGFTPNVGSRQFRTGEPPPILEIPVEIATMYAPGPRPRSQIQQNVSPPRYSDQQFRGSGGSNYSIPPNRGYM